jgi:hypothetical protein
MSQEHGFSHALAAAFEATYGVTPGSPTPYAMPFLSCNLAGKQDLVDLGILNGTNRRDPQAPELSPVTVDGDVVVPLDNNALGWWLKAAFGAPTTTGSTNYSHAFKIGAAQPSMSMERKYGGFATPQYALYTGCKVARLSLDTQDNQGGAVPLTLALAGSNRTFSTSQTLTTPAAQTLSLFKFAHASMTEGGSAISNVSRVSLQVDFGLNAGIKCVGGSGRRTHLPEGLVAVTGQISALFESDALLAKALAGTETALVLTYTIGANNLLEITIKELVLQPVDPAVTGPAGLLVELPFKAYFANASPDVTIIQAVLKNQVASYA